MVWELSDEQSVEGILENLVEKVLAWNCAIGELGCSRVDGLDWFDCFDLPLIVLG